MPYLKIESCCECPHHARNNFGLPNDCDMFGIKCNHEDQECSEVYHAKIKNKTNGIYFKCPLDNNKED